MNTLNTSSLRHRGASRSRQARLLFGLLAATALGATVALNSGCIVAAAGVAGAGTVAFVEGKFVAHVGNSYNEVVRAVEVALPQSQIALIDEKRDALETKITARTSGDTKVEIDVTREADNLAKLEIRVGTFGDKDESLSIFNQIKSNL